MSTERKPEEERWAVTWADNRRAQLTDALSVTPAQRLAWLEEAIKFADSSRLSRSDDRVDAPDPRTG